MGCCGMIKNHDRSGWFGASDTSIIMGNWSTETFRKWWMVKLGAYDTPYTNRAMKTGTLLEIPIIRTICDVDGRRIRIGRKPVYRPRYRVRANYDGYTSREVVEIKTTEHGFRTVPKNYWQQCQVLMWAKGLEKAVLYAYTPLEIDYAAPYFPEIDPERIKRFDIEYSDGFIQEYLPRVRYLSVCLKRRAFPRAEEMPDGA
nr:MAG TPA: Exonuclease [Caudoviricetes sp.]